MAASKHIVSPTTRTPLGLQALLTAVGSLRDALARRGARLVVREGPWERVVPAVVAEVGAVEVVTEDEVEHR